MIYILLQNLSGCVVDAPVTPEPIYNAMQLSMQNPNAGVSPSSIVCSINLHPEFSTHAAAPFPSPTSPFTASKSPTSLISSSISTPSAFRFKKLKYVCQPMAITPPKIFLKSGGRNVKLNAVTRGHSLQLLMKLVGTVRLTCSTAW